MSIRKTSARTSANMSASVASVETTNMATIAPATITSISGGGTLGAPQISTVYITDSSYNILDDTAVSTAGGYVKLIGTGFKTGCILYVAGVAATSTAFISATEIRCQLAATASNTQVIYLVNPDGSAAVRLSGITFSGSPAWVTSATLPSSVSGSAFSVSLAATSDSAISYSLASGSTLPTGTTLTSAGVFSGTVTGLSADTTYSFNIVATDLELQDTARTFSITFVIGEPYFKNTVLLINGEASDKTWIADTSTNSFNVLTTGDAKPSAFSPYNTYFSNYFDGTGDYLTVPTNTAFDISSSTAMTFECWVFNTTTDTFVLACRGWGYGGAGPVIAFHLNNGVTPSWSYAHTGASTYTLATSSINGVLGQWNHYAFNRTAAGVCNIYVNGVLGVTRTDTNVMTSATEPVYIGVSTNLASPYAKGYMRDMRWIVGSSIYDTAFTPPTAPLTAITNTKLLTCQNNKIVDNSPTPAIISKFGDVAIKAFSPFLETDLITGSGYFNGTSRLTVSDNANLQPGAGDFTIEGWFYLTAVGTARGLVSKGAAATGVAVSVTAGNLLQFSTTGANFTGTTTVAINTWYHFALVRSGTTGFNINLYLNGVLEASSSTANNTNFSQTDALYIGADRAAGSPMLGYMSNVRLVKGTAVYTAAFTPPTTPLAVVNNTSLLILQSRVAHNNNSTLDTSGNQSIATKFGNATVGTFSPFSQAGWSNYFDGTTDYLIGTSNAALALPGDFTFECWIYPTTITGAERGIFGIGTTDPNSNLIRIQQSTSKLQFWLGGSNSAGPGTGTKTGIITCNTALSLNTWYHIAWVRSNSGTNNVKLYLNGVLDGQGTGTYSIDQANCSVGMGYPGSTIESFFGYISNVRLVKGSALYTSDFTPSTSALTAIANTSLLTCNSNRFVDNSGNSIAITASGSAAVQAFSPFIPSDSYNPTNNIGSGYYDGTTDYHSFPLVLPNLGNFTFELWAYGSSAVSGMAICGSSEFEVYLSVLNVSWVYQGVISVASGFNFIPNQWNHIVICRYNWVSGVSGNFKIFVNGQMYTSPTPKGETMSIATGPFITGGSYYTNVFRNGFPGYISNVRFTLGNGTIYTAAFTPPTTPTPPLNNTVLMLNYNTGGVVDQTGRNNIETVADVRISNTVEKFGSGSIVFDGTGDWLTVANNVNIQMGSRDFTIEGWVYLTTLGAARGLVSKGGSATGLIINITAANLLQASYTATALTGTTALVANTWYHFAMVRSGTATGNIKIYLNGVLEATSATAITTDFNQTETMYIGADRVGGSPMLGYMDDVRVTKNVARYTSAFTPPTSAFITK